MFLYDSVCFLQPLLLFTQIFTFKEFWCFCVKGKKFSIVAQTCMLLLSPRMHCKKCKIISLWRYNCVWRTNSLSSRPPTNSFLKLWMRQNVQIVGSSNENCRNKCTFPNRRCDIPSFFLLRILPDSNSSQTRHVYIRNSDANTWPISKFMSVNFISRHAVFWMFFQKIHIHYF